MREFHAPGYYADGPRHHQARRLARSRRRLSARALSAIRRPAVEHTGVLAQRVVAARPAQGIVSPSTLDAAGKDPIGRRRRYVGMIATTRIYLVSSSQGACGSLTLGLARKIQECSRCPDTACRYPAHNKCHQDQCPHRHQFLLRTASVACHKR